MNSALKDYQTTIPAAITGIINILPYFGVAIPINIVSGVTTIALVIIGFFAASGKTTSGE